MIDYSYMNAEGPKEQYEYEDSRVHIDNHKPQLSFIRNGYILPTRQDKSRIWGAGGVLDSEKRFVEISGIDDAFGGKYDIADSEVKVVHETVLYIGVIPDHWGHFLIDCVSRIWGAMEVRDSVIIAYCTFTYDYNPLAGNYGEFIKLLGIDTDRFIRVEMPMKFDEIIIPERIMSFGLECNAHYVSVIKKVIDNALSVPIDNEVIDKIYFSRRHFRPAIDTEVGEEEIEENFRRNGFAVLYPEELSLRKLIFYLQNCRVAVSLSGTAAHNAIFAGKDAKIIILNRICVPNQPQLRLNKLFDIDHTYVDVYNSKMLKTQNHYGAGVAYVEVTKYLENWLRDNGYAIHKKNVKTKNEIDYLIKSSVYNTGKKIRMMKNRIKFVCPSLYCKVKKIKHRFTKRGD